MYWNVNTATECSHRQKLRGGKKANNYSHLICSDQQGFRRRTFRTNCIVTRAPVMKLVWSGDKMDKERMKLYCAPRSFDTLTISLKFSLFYYATLNLLNTFLNATRSTITQQIEISFKVVFNKSLYLKIKMCFPFIHDTVVLTTFHPKRLLHCNHKKKKRCWTYLDIEAYPTLTSGQKLSLLNRHKPSLYITKLTL